MVNATIDNPTIELKEITLTYEGKVLVEDFSLVVGRGEKMVLRGASGRGKTTLLRAILGFSQPTKGHIVIGGKLLGPNTVWQLRTQIGYVPQEPELGEGNVRQWLERPFNYKANKLVRGNMERIPELFRDFFLPMDLLEKEVQVLSGGEKQRVAIVSAILLERPILLLDEPTSALDEQSKERLIHYLASKKDLTALVVSHDREVLSIAHKVVTLS